VVNNALDYLLQNAPPIRTAVARDSPEWKDFVAKPSLTFVLRLLTGLAHSHVTTQLALAADSIPLFHHLEQISSDEHVGSLAENLLEAMRGHPEVFLGFVSFVFLFHLCIITIIIFYFIFINF
jgi:E3 ubiquitin-protein ligase UBR4